MLQRLVGLLVALGLESCLRVLIYKQNHYKVLISTFGQDERCVCLFWLQKVALWCCLHDMLMAVALALGEPWRACTRLLQTQTCHAHSAQLWLLCHAKWLCMYLLGVGLPLCACKWHFCTMHDSATHTRQSSHQPGKPWRAHTQGMVLTWRFVSCNSLLRDSEYEYTHTHTQIHDCALQVGYEFVNTFHEYDPAWNSRETHDTYAQQAHATIARRVRVNEIHGAVIDLRPNHKDLHACCLVS